MIRMNNNGYENENGGGRERCIGRRERDEIDADQESKLARALFDV
jgi:hypothetical protein